MLAADILARIGRCLKKLSKAGEEMCESRGPTETTIDLIRQYRSAYTDEGRSSALEALYTVTRPQILAFSQTLTGNPTDAEDLFMKAMDKALRSIARFRGNSSGEFLGWCRTIVRNMAIDRSREAWTCRVQVLPSDEMERLMDASDGAESIYPQNPDDLDAVKAALIRLDDNSRMCVELAYFHDQNDEEIGSILGISGNAARVRRDRAVQKLRTILKGIR